jgi:hypothetical protein
VAEVAGVEIELAPKLGHRNVIAMSQPEQHPGLGKTEFRSGEIGPQQAMT